MYMWLDLQNFDSLYLENAWSYLHVIFQEFTVTNGSSVELNGLPF